MGHCIRAFIGNSEKINFLSDNWAKNPIQLSEGLSMLFLTNELYDEITESAKMNGEITRDNETYLNSAIISVMEAYSNQGKLAYIETDYFGGVGTQTAILYENGKQKFPPIFTDDFKMWTPSEE